MLSFISNIFIKLMGGTRNERIVRNRMAIVRNKINPLWDKYIQELSELARSAATPEHDGETLVKMALNLEWLPLATRDWLSAKTANLKARLAKGDSVASVLPEAFACTRMASWLARNHRQFDVQLVAGEVLFENCIAEEATGEGKTIACYPAIYLAVLTGMKVHVITVNDYLVKRDRDFAAPVFEAMGVSVGAIQAPMRPRERHVEYACDVIYGTNSEFGFDYLRDNISTSPADQVQKGQDYAIIDEVDSILIDEARTPLIISGPALGDVERFRKADGVTREVIKRHQPYDLANKRVESLKRQEKSLEGELGKVGSDEKAGVSKRLAETQAELAASEAALTTVTKYFDVELERKSAHLTHEGITAAQDVAGVGSFYVGNNMEWPHLLDQSLRAHIVYQRDKEYVVRDGEVIIVDEFTGRLMEGRQWSDGLHQAVEAKERVTIKEENQTLATITYQNLFKLYKKLAGMTGTAMTESEEFMKIYKLDVINVPTHRPVNRVDHQDRIYGTVEEKLDAIVEEVNTYSKRGRPVLVGTTSIEKSDHLSNMMTRRYGIVHEVLNARPENAAREADIVALAGRQRALKPGSKEMVGNVTIATNMAGRGTDIKLGPGVVWPNCKVPPSEEFARLGVAMQGLYPPGVTKCCIHCPEYNAKTNCAHCFKPKLDADFPRRGTKECPLDVPCGLHIVGTERHEARRIDNQLRGRSGRQGDPGSSRFFLSLRDDLMAIFAGEWTLKVLGWLGLQNGQAIEDKRISKGIERAQKKVEQRNFDTRKTLLEYDEVMDHQRRYFYTRRQQLLESKDVEITLRELIDETIADAAADYLASDYPKRCMAEFARVALEVNITPEKIHGDSPEDLSSLDHDLKAFAIDEARTAISITIGEYVDPDTDPQDWDLRGLSSWAMSRFKVDVSQNTLRKMDVAQMEEAVSNGAAQYIEQLDLSGLLRFLQPDFRSASLAEWARNKFGVTLTVAQLPTDDPDKAQENLRKAVEQAYLRREIEYPPTFAIDITVGQSGPDNAYARKALCDWASRKYEANWTLESTDGKTVEVLTHELIAMAEQFMIGGKLDQTVDAFLATLPQSSNGKPDEATLAAAVEWVTRRFDTQLTPEELAGEPLGERLIAVGRAFLRRELTELERIVLLQIYDASWKDHLLAMDHLRESVGLRRFAEQDPKIVYKKEGFRQFQEMLNGVREKVTDIIFKVRLGGQTEVRNVYQVSRMVHSQLTGYDHLAQDMAAQQQAAAAPQKVEPIVRVMPKVGRNDPCPCGSGKKFKKCCGKE